MSGLDMLVEAWMGRTAFVMLSEVEWTDVSF